ncbi:MAG: phosphoglycerate mutase family protein [Chloroflexi bacterium]|nr:phosphoglycerate mutase family protein [Chloroflexota bacterium]
MRILEVRRHSYTKKGADRGHGSHLSREGVALARRLGAEIGPFDRVVTSMIPRTLETALAMGFAVDESIADLGQLTEGFWTEVGRHEHWSWPQPFAHYRTLIATGQQVAALGQTQVDIWIRLLEMTPPNGAVLAISHGHAIEVGLVTCFPAGQLDKLDRPFSHCEGFRVHYADGEFIKLEIQRNGDYK